MNKNNVSDWSISSMLIVQEAQKMGATINRIHSQKNLFSLFLNGKDFFFKNIDCGLNSAFGFKMAEDKQLTYMLLDIAGVPIAYSQYLDKGEIENFLLNEKWNFPLVVKPVDGAHGDGVFVDIQTKDTLQQAIIGAQKYSKTLVIQSYISGEDHRVLVVGDKVIAVAKREPASVMGDGKCTIQQLIDRENKNPLRGKGDHISPLESIKVDDEVLHFLNKNKYTLDSIPEQGEQVFLRGNANLSTGGKAIDLTDSIHPSIAEYAVKAAKALGLAVAGVDILTNDISLPLETTKGVVIEVNATPGLRMHHYPSIGTPRNVARAILNELLKNK